MKYMGSKSRIAKFIVPIMLTEAYKYGFTTWVEPFVGGGNVIDKAPREFKRVGIDCNPHTINALIAIRDLVEELPDSLTEEQYKELRTAPDSYINSWLRFICSFGGKFDGGYARERGCDETTFVGYGRRNARRQSPNLQGVNFITASYDWCSDYKRCLIYCDPPYEQTTSYKTGSFDHQQFWEWCRIMSTDNLLFVSEYKAPDDFVCVWEGGIKTNFASQRATATHKQVEKLFKYSYKLYLKEMLYG